MNRNVHEMLQSEANQLKDELIAALIANDQRATGRTISMIEANAGDTFLEVTGPHWIQQLQYGRGPTKNAGDGSVYYRILEWVKAKGVVFQDNIQQSRYSIEERTARFITFYIHRYGTYHHRHGVTYSGERNPVLRVFNDERIEAIAQRFGNMVMQGVSSEIFEELKK